MQTIICTLYEKHYHYGVAALINSLTKHGFEGDFYIGCRGNLPFWAKNVTEIIDITEKNDWKSIRKVVISENVTLHFILLETDFHLTNYKPAFMCDLWDSFMDKPDGIFYFDPDIVINCTWSFYETWIKAGIALVHEIIFNDMPINHPVRKMWTDIILSLNHKVNHNMTSYINGGFCGISKENIEFIYLWKEVIAYGISHRFMTPQSFWDFKGGRENPFVSQDQDALNIAAMAVNLPLSEYGPEGMGFIYGDILMAHATCSPKPWKKKYLLSAMKGSPPSLADKAYWDSVSGVLEIYGAWMKRRKKIAIKIASFIGRFYRKY